MLNINQEFISKSQIRQQAPSIFTAQGAPGTSEKYAHIPTDKIIDDMSALGWGVVDAKEVKARKGVGFQKHLVVFRNNDIQITAEDGDNVFPQILLTNSHDGKAAFNFRVGIFRLVCSNGLVISDADFNNVSIRHINYTFETLQTKIQEVIAKLPGLVQKINLFKSTQLTENQMTDFATKAAALRTKQRVDVLELLNAERTQDQGNDLWVVFNRIQEKLLGGSYKAGKRKARSVKNFQKDIQINEQLFELAESYL